MSQSCVIRTGPDACVEGLPDSRQYEPRGPSAQKLYYKRFKTEWPVSSSPNECRTITKSSSTKDTKQNGRSVRRPTNAGPSPKALLQKIQNRMAGQFVAQRMPDQHQSATTKIQIKGPVPYRREQGPPKSSTNTQRVKTNQWIRVVEASTRQRDPASGRPRGPGLMPTHITGGNHTPAGYKNMT